MMIPRCSIKSKLAQQRLSLTALWSCPPLDEWTTTLCDNLFDPSTTEEHPENKQRVATSPPSINSASLVEGPLYTDGPAPRTCPRLNEIGHTSSCNSANSTLASVTPQNHAANFFGARLGLLPHSNPNTSMPGSCRSQDKGGPSTQS